MMDTTSESAAAIEAAILGLPCSVRHLQKADGEEISFAQLVEVYQDGHCTARLESVAAIRPLVTALAERAERAEAQAERYRMALRHSLPGSSMEIQHDPKPVPMAQMERP